MRAITELTDVLLVLWLTVDFWTGCVTAGLRLAFVFFFFLFVSSIPFYFFVRMPCSCSMIVDIVNTFDFGRDIFSISFDAHVFSFIKILFAETDAWFWFWFNVCSSVCWMQSLCVFFFLRLFCSLLQCRIGIVAILRWVDGIDGWNGWLLGFVWLNWIGLDWLGLCRWWFGKYLLFECENRVVNICVLVKLNSSDCSIIGTNCISIVTKDLKMCRIDYCSFLQDSSNHIFTNFNWLWNEKPLAQFDLFLSYTYFLSTSFTVICANFFDFIGFCFFFFSSNFPHKKSRTHAHIHKNPIHL